MKVIRFILLMVILPFACLPLSASIQSSDSIESISLLTEYNDTLKPQASIRSQKISFINKVADGIGRFVSKIYDVDTTYIEPHHYKFQVMIQNTNNIEYYNLYGNDGENISFSPDVSSKIGSYVGYSLIFLGAAIQLNHLYVGNTKKSFDLSVYTPIIGIDIFYRNNRNGYKIRSVTLSGHNEVKGISGTDFDDFNANYSGFNIYYIFNHRHHSYPAAYNQSTRQKRSSGSLIAGLGYSIHNIDVDWQKLDDVIKEYYPAFTNDFSSESLFGSIRYQCFTANLGYAYNFVPARNILIGTSLSAGLSYNRTMMETGQTQPFSFNNFRAQRLSLGGVGRMGIVWNNDRYFIGGLAVLHLYSYRERKFRTSNLFGNVNFYCGFNFGKKKQYRAKDTFFEF